VHAHRSQSEKPGGGPIGSPGARWAAEPCDEQGASDRPHDGQDAGEGRAQAADPANIDQIRETVTWLGLTRSGATRVGGQRTTGNVAARAVLDATMCAT
jgi:hypothetical protein